MKLKVPLPLPLLLLFLLLVAALGYAAGVYTADITVARQVLRAAAQAEGFEGGARIRHATIGNILKVQIHTNAEARHIEVVGTKGTRSWWE